MPPAPTFCGRWCARGVPEPIPPPLGLLPAEAAAPAHSLLPPPDEAFASVAGPPAFLSPEATKQLNVAPGVALGAYRRPGDVLGEDEEEEDAAPVDRSAATGSAVLASAAVTYE